MQDRILPPLLVLFGLTLVALISYCIEDEYYAAKQQAFVHELSFEESIQLGLNQQQFEKLMEINSAYFCNLQDVYNRNPSTLKMEVNLLASERLERISSLLTNKQLCTWRALQKKDDHKNN